MDAEVVSGILVWVQAVAAVVAAVFAITGPLRRKALGRIPQVPKEATTTLRRQAPRRVFTNEVEVHRRSTLLVLAKVSSLLTIPTAMIVWVLDWTLIEPDWFDASSVFRVLYVGCAGTLLVVIACLNRPATSSRVETIVLWLVPLAILIAVLRNAGISTFDLSGIWAPALVVFLRRSKVGPLGAAIASVVAAVLGVVVTGQSLSFLPAGLCLLVGVLWNLERSRVSADRAAALLAAGLLTGISVLILFFGEHRRWQLEAFFSPSGGAHFSYGWQLDGYQLIESGMNGVGTGDPTYFERLVKSVQAGWPITLAAGTGILPATLIIGILLIGYLALLWLAQERERIPAMVLLGMLVGNLLVVQGALPMFGLVALGFGSSGWILGGGAMLALAINSAHRSVTHASVTTGPIAGTEFGRADVGQTT